MTHDVTVDLGDRSYPIRIGSDILDSLGADCKAAGLTGRCLIVSDENVAPLYAENVFKSLEKAGFCPVSEVLPAGEPTKCHEQLLNLYAKAAENRLDRKCFMVALGGGVIGDLTGFAAASWLRGIKFVQVPTSLLAMVDSSVGGKTGINIPAGKNLVGAFHQPELVMIDLDTLKTLPEREFAAGMSEVAKYGVIWDSRLFQTLEKSPNDFPNLGKIISRCCEIKAEVVRQDEREGGLRGILNFGHTLAHAIENVAGYGQFLHGEAVAIGMVYAARLSVALKGLSVEESERIEKLLAALKLPVTAPGLVWSDLRKAMAVDKKTVGGLPKFVLTDRIGHVDFGCELPEELMEEVWDGIGQ
ncbi:3-dehydroquinate synthase [Tichowtungia aerotolerans]|uniref:3-dehydroquinate synthase n=1 Tax=Tichowtungia aerotolerans TaxID=2697043 RepID=A0A6P1MCJ9_9BACT|nr:3-dehydroquinate synthase [Tichowtungia aerotolerans]QHI68815.1 3-dehydroquinate synthase [Tichowtungia aerotolerans]